MNASTAFLNWQTQITQEHGRLNGWHSIVLPLVDCHNDCVEVYFQENDGVFLLTDDDATLNDLEMQGVDVESDVVLRQIDDIIAGFGVERAERQLKTTASSLTLGQKLSMLGQAMCAVSHAGRFLHA